MKFSHRDVIKVAIIIVILVTVVWSIVNVSEYAHKFHNGLVVWTLGASVGTANALSVYAFVIARTRNVKVAAVSGVILFGAMSGALQTLLYIGNGAPVVAAFAFGWFGPVAEGVLSWLHAVLSEEQVGKVAQRKPVSHERNTVTVAPVTQQLPEWVTSVTSKGDTEIAELTGVTRQSIYRWRKAGVLGDKLIEKLPAPVTVSTNGKEHS